MMDEIPTVTSILHPTDFSPASESAFAHALAVALKRETKLTLLHVMGKDAVSSEWTSFPGVRGTLERWGLLEAGSPRSAVFDEHGIRVSKVKMRHEKPMKAIVNYLDLNPTDFIVLATEGRSGVPSWLEESVAEKVARQAGLLTLFVPESTRGIVDVQTGEVSLTRVLLPFDRDPDPREAIQRATRLNQLSDGDPLEIVLLHIGKDAPPLPELPLVENITWRVEGRTGDAVDEIVKMATELDVSLVVMPTAGRNGILDALRGSTTEQVLRRTGRPLVAVPGS